MTCHQFTVTFWRAFELSHSRTKVTNFAIPFYCLYATSYWSIILHPVSHCLCRWLAKFWLSINVASLQRICLGLTLNLRTTNFDVENLETSFYHTLSRKHFGTNRKLICSFLLVINSNLYHILHRFYRAAWNADAVLRWEFCLSVRPSVRPSVCRSVRPSVCQTRALWQNGRKICLHFYTIRKTMYSSFLRKRMVGGGTTLLPEILGQPVRIGAKSPILNR